MQFEVGNLYSSDEVGNLAPSTLNENPNHFIENNKEGSTQNTKRLEDDGVLPILGFVQKELQESDREAARRYPELNNERRFLKILNDSLPLIDKNGDGMSKRELDDFLKGPQRDSLTGAAARIARNHTKQFAHAGHSEFWFEKIDARDIKVFNTRLDVKEMAQHPALRDPVLFADTLLGIHEKVYKGQDIPYQSYSLHAFAEGKYYVDKNITDLERAAAAKAYHNYSELAGITPKIRFVADFLTKEDLEMIKAVSQPDFEEKVEKAIDENPPSKTNPIARGIGWAVVGYVIGSAIGVEDPGEIAITTGISGALTAGLEDITSEELAEKILERRTYLANLDLFDLPENKK